jgi:hypothetical protein
MSAPNAAWVPGAGSRPAPGFQAHPTSESCVAAPDIVLARPQHLDRGAVADRLRDGGRFARDDAVQRGTPPEAAAGEERVHAYPVGRDAGDASDDLRESLQFRDLPDSYLPDCFDSFDRVLALDWDRMIPGHPYAGGRLGAKDDVRAAKQYMVDLSDAVKEIKLPKYEKWRNYDTYLPGNIERFCEFWGGGF